MTKVINVALHAITCEFVGRHELASVTGEVVGSTFHTDPDNIADAEDTIVIHAFPDGPVRIAHGQVVEVRPKSVAFSLSTPSTEPDGLSPKFLKIEGTLNNGLGSSHLTLDHSVELPTSDEAPELRTMTFQTPQLRVHLVLALTLMAPTRPPASLAAPTDRQAG